MTKDLNYAINCLVTTDIAVIGQRIKELRSQAGLTLEEVATKGNCTPGFLSQVERNKAAPSISMLYSIAEAIGVKVTDFLPDAINETKVVRRDSRNTFHFTGSTVVYSLLSTKFSYASLDAFHLTIKPAGQGLPTDEFRAHTGEEFGYILEGVLRLWIGEKFYDLYPGDSVHFQSGTAHRLENRTQAPALALWLNSPSFF
jgi:transcriptional regulator with XRE-family HTH domain